MRVSANRKAELLVENIRVNIILFLTLEYFSTFEVSTHCGKSIKVTLGSYFMKTTYMAKTIPRLPLSESYRKSTRELVGLQLWRGAFLLADYICEYPQLFESKNVLELAAGTGLTSIVAANWAKKVLCTDVDLGEILNLIRRNFALNEHDLEADCDVREIDFFRTDWKTKLTSDLRNIDTILVADVIYNEEITKSFVNVLEELVTNFCDKGVTIYIAMEKRLRLNSEGEIVAPSYEVFMDCMKCFLKKNPSCDMQNVDLKFPQYFKQHYARVDELVMFKIECLKIIQ